MVQGSPQGPLIIQFSCGIVKREVALIATLEGDCSQIYSMTFSPDGSRLASVINDREVYLWDGKTGTRIATIEGQPNTIGNVMFSADSGILTRASGNGTVELWESKSGHFLGVGDIWYYFFRDLLPSRYFSELFSLTQHSELGVYGLIPLSPDSNPLFWFPPDVTPSHFALNPTCPLLAVGCEEGRVLFLDISRVIPS